MTTAHEVLDRLAEIGATVRPAGDNLIVRAGAKPVPAELVRRVRHAKADILAALAPAAVAAAVRWRDRFAARTVHWFHNDRRWADAECLAYGEVTLDWHRRHGARPDPRLCAGCGDDLPGETGLVLCDGARVHLDGVRGVNCVIAYGKKWRGAAVAGLTALGLDPPSEFDP
jgi:hypothetical protein